MVAHIFRGRWIATSMLIVALALLAPAVASAGTFRWKTDGNGIWVDPANWQHLSGPVGSGFPNGRDDVAVFSFSISADRVVTIPADTVITIGTLQIAESFNLTIEGAGTAFPGVLIFDSSAASATLDVIGDNHAHQIRAEVELRSDLTIDVFNDGSSLSFFRGIIQLGPVARGLKKAGHGMVRFLSTIANEWGGPTVVEEGTIEILQADTITAIPGDLVIGLANGDSPAVVQVLAGNGVLHRDSTVRVLATGTLDVRQFSQSLNVLQIFGGYVSVGRGSMGGLLSAEGLNMIGGTLNVGAATARYRLAGAAEIISSATQSAIIQGTGGLLLNGTESFIVHDGPAESDLMMSLAIVDNAANFGIIKNGSGTMRFFGPSSNTYTGVTTVQQGRLELARQSPAATIRGQVVVGGAGRGAELAILQSNTIDDTSSISVLAEGVLTMKSATDRITTLTLIDGTATIADATLEPLSVSMTGSTMQLATPTSVLSFNGGSLVATSRAGRPSVIGGSGTVSLNGAQRTFVVSDGPDAVDLRVDAIISGNATEGITKSQTGVALFTGRNSYDGPTAVNAGTLIVTGTLTSAVNVATSATLRGTGRVDAIVAQNGSTVSPGLSPGVITTGPLSLHNGATFFVELQGQTAGAGYDQVRVAGGVELNGAHLTLVVGPSLGSPFGQYRLIDNDGADPVAGTFAGLPEGATIVAAAEDAAEFTISYRGGDGNDVVLTAAGEVSYFLAEGATGAFFDEDVLIANPNTVDAPVTVTFLREGGSALVRTYTIARESRLTIRVDEIPELTDAAVSVKVVSDAKLPLTVERTMFWDATHYGGHTSNAVPRAERRWTFAEGAQGFFDTYVLLANANATPTTATITFLLENAAPVVKDVSLLAFSRKTVWAGDYSEVRDRSFGIIVDAADPVIAERAMYFGSVPGQLWTGGHVNTGTTAPSTSWFHAEGATGAFFYTFILMSNPQTTPAHLTLRFLLEGGGEVTLTKTIEPQSRLTVNPAAEGDPRLERGSMSTVVTSDVPIVSERSMYWGGGDGPGFTEGHNSSGMVTTATRWGLADGRVGGPESFFTYILLANPAPESANVTVTFLREGGAPPVVKTYTVLGASRFNVDVSTVTELQNESFGARIDVTNGVPIAIERSIYWNANGIFWAGGTNALGTPLP
jgi:autotransporter-associated beta strand protein